ncbi:hypothetical protein [Saccharothrix sp. HUAS TT1]|uniref:hypothetical protein n=1 Tax=unclassified Saccharothrix TaxID=2593673 RepID=UPI00345BE15C
MSSDPFENDPFSDGDADEAQTAIAPGPAADAVPAWDGSATYTFKGKGGFDSSWLVVRAPSLGRLAELLEDRDEVKRLVDAATAVDAYLKSKDPGSGQGQARQGGGSGGGGKPAGASRHPKGKTSQCEHGERVYKSGQKKNGSGLWHAFDCPQNVCDREWTTA